MIHLFQPSNAYSPIHWNWVTLTGPDALDFLHRVTTVNTQGLQTGQGSPGCFLTPQGKLRAYFTLWNYGEGEYGFEFDSGQAGRWKDSLLAAIDQYTFSEKMVLADVSSLECRWIFADLADDSSLREALAIPANEKFEAGHTLAIDDEIRVCHHGVVDFGRNWISVWGRPARLAQWLERALPDAQTVAFEQIESWRIQANRPWVDHELTDATIPLEAGLTDAIAPNKGCYPGQEVIEKIVSLGSPARRLATLEGTGPAPSVGTKMLSTAEPAMEVGLVTSVHATGDRFIALGFVRKIHAKEGFSIRLEGSTATATLTRIAPYAE